MKLLLTLALLSAGCLAQIENPRPQETHRFLDRTAKIGLLASAGVFAADAIQSCNHVNHGSREEWLPVKSCAGISLWMVGNFAEQIGVAYLFHRSRHHRLERIAEFVGASGSAAGIIASRRRLSAPPEPLVTNPVPGGHIVNVCTVGQNC